MAMAFKIEYISTFHRDVSGIVDSLEDFPQKAKRVLEQLDKKLSRLVDNPELYPIYEDYPDFRKIAVEDYLAFYTINKRDGIIEIHRLIYGRMDIAKHLS